MTQDEIIRMAREAGAAPYTNRHYPDRTTHTFSPDQLERFAELIRADEREAVEDLLKEYDMINSAFAKDFRARGQA
jgi:hypothetical protein